MPDDQKTGGRLPMTPTALNAFRNTLADCELAVYVDLGSRTVLSSDGALHYPQEYLDVLCTCAADLFDAAPKGEEPVEHVLFLSPTGSRGFFRNLADPCEALCCICSAEVGFERLIENARAALVGESTAQ
ncbi:hypothetical protein O2N63_01975 [Aliiroseovarius sp. KMU-50]|uniref:Uncharacterized protein n=1 Tax=Aliiroseovarius salicola TaxID=3009082 RepID=A0ABT4VX76_9RHOB|nr:hypothetical protein [Aliiroseovarius sp. KMU-50]MDA5092849.1 hypothetical protein [Aliiroseovarius sp. KMU-50]